MKRNSIVLKMFAAAAICGALWGCGTSGTPRGVEVNEADAVEVERLDTAIFRFVRLPQAERRQMCEGRLRAYWQGWLSIMDMGPVEPGSLARLAVSPAVKAFGPAVRRVFGDFTPYADTIGSALAAVRREKLAVPDYGYATVVWGADKSIIVCDSIMYIALNHYLGPGHEAYAGFPDFLRQNKAPAMMKYNVVETALGLTYPYQPPAAGATVLSRLVYEGALAYLKMRFVPWAQEARALGFTEAQLTDIRKNEGFMWQQLVGRGLLYSTDAEIVEALLRPARCSAPISPDAPGRAAVYMGYRIVSAYMEAHPSTPLRTLLSPVFYNSPDLLRTAGYAPPRQ